MFENVWCFIKPLLAALRGCCRARPFGTGCFQSNTNLGISLCGFFIFHLLSPLHLTWELLFQDNPADKGNGLCIRYEAEEIAKPINTPEHVGRDLQRAGARYNGNISECIYVAGAALFCFVWKTRIHVG